MMKKLHETLEAQLIVVPNTTILTDNMVAQWSGVKYPELATLLVHLQFLASVHQMHHWQVKGGSFYGDHLMFERMYEATQEQIDPVAEKAIGLGGTSNVDLLRQASQLQKLAAGYGPSMTIPQDNELSRRALAAEYTFLTVVDHLITLIEERGAMTRGLENLLAGIEYVHEQHVYLLKGKL